MLATGAAFASPASAATNQNQGDPQAQYQQQLDKYNAQLAEYNAALAAYDKAVSGGVCATTGGGRFSALPMCGQNGTPRKPTPPTEPTPPTSPTVTQPPDNNCTPAGSAAALSALPICGQTDPNTGQPTNADYTAPGTAPVRVTNAQACDLFSFIGVGPLVCQLGELVQTIGQAHGYGSYSPADSFSGGTGDQIVQILGDIVSGAAGAAGEELIAEAEEVSKAIETARVEEKTLRTMPDGVQRVVTEEEYSNAWKQAGKLPGGAPTEDPALVQTITHNNGDKYILVRYSDGTTRSLQIDSSSGADGKYITVVAPDGSSRSIKVIDSSSGSEGSPGPNSGSTDPTGGTTSPTSGTTSPTSGMTSGRGTDPSGAIVNWRPDPANPGEYLVDITPPVNVNPNEYPTWFLNWTNEHPEAWRNVKLGVAAVTATGIVIGVPTTVTLLILNYYNIKNDIDPVTPAPVSGSSSHKRTAAHR